MDQQSLREVRRTLRQIMWEHVSLCRDEQGLLEARRQVRALRQSCVRFEGQQREFLETANMLLVAELVIAAALERRESRGSHWRLDYQYTDESLEKQHYAFQPQHSNPSGLVQAREEVVPHV